MKLYFKKPMVLLPHEPKEEKPVTLDQFLSSAISRSNDSRDPVKLWHWAIQVSSEGKLDLDTSDVDFLQEIIKNSQFLTVLGKGQILDVINEAKTRELMKDSKKEEKDGSPKD